MSESWLTLSRTIPIAIFILASYALWESLAPFKKRRRLSQTGAWKKPAGGFETDERMWNNLGQEDFRDAGFTIWPHAFYSAFMVADLLSLSGFG